FVAGGGRGRGVLGGDDLRPGQRARLALAAQRFQGQVEVQAAAHDAERDAGGAGRDDAGQDGADRQVHDVATIGQAVDRAHRQQGAGGGADENVVVDQAAEAGGPDAAAV